MRYMAKEVYNACVYVIKDPFFFDHIKAFHNLFEANYILHKLKERKQSESEQSLR